MLNNKSLKEFVESLFDKDKEPNSEGIHIKKADNTYWTITLCDKNCKNIKIYVNGVLLGDFEKIEIVGKNQYVYIFNKNDKNCRKYSEYYDLINCRFEDFNIFTTKLN